MPERQVTPIRLLLVEDHEVVRLGLRKLVRRSDRIDVVGECETAIQAVTKALGLKPDVVLMDLCLPDGRGVEACRGMRVACPDTRVLFFTSFGDEDAVLSTTFADTTGYLMKQIDGRSLVNAVELVAKGHSILDPTVAGTMLMRMRFFATTNADSVTQVLSPQERRILSLVAEGKTNKEIATALGLIDNTVKSYLYSIFHEASGFPPFASGCFFSNVPIA